jgi:hypothetical protein
VAATRHRVVIGRHNGAGAGDQPIVGQARGARKGSNATIRALFATRSVGSWLELDSSGPLRSLGYPYVLQALRMLKSLAVAGALTLLYTSTLSVRQHQGSAPRRTYDVQAVVDTPPIPDDGTVIQAAGVEGVAPTFPADTTSTSSAPDSMAYGTAQSDTASP